jgi:hypothetical protein
VIPSVSLGEKLVTLVDRLKTEGFQGQTIRDHTISRAFDLAIELQVVETEKVLNCFIRARRDAFSLRPKHLSSCPGSFQGVKNSDTRGGLCSGTSAPWAVLLNDIGWLVFRRTVFGGMTLAVIAVHVGPFDLRKQHHPGVYM